jgi:hypothetical protein
MKNSKNIFTLTVLMVIVFFLAGCGILPTPTPTPTDDEGVLMGQVMAPEGAVMAKQLTGQALANATVNIIDPDTGEVIATTTTDENGNYEVNVPEGGPYILQAEKDNIVIQQVTPEVESKKEYDLGTADETTTAIALIAQAMLEAEDFPDDLADIDLRAIENDPNFDDVLDTVQQALLNGENPAQAVEVIVDVWTFLYPDESTPPAPSPPGPTPPAVKDATFEATGSYGIHNNKVYAGYELQDEDNAQIPLFESNIEKISVEDPDGTTTDLTVVGDSDPLLWFNIAKEAGTYTYTIETKDGDIYEATIEWLEPTEATVSFQAPTSAADVFTGATGDNPAKVDFSKVTADKLLDWTSVKDGYYAIELKIEGVNLSESNVDYAFRVYGDGTAIEPEIKGDLDCQYVTTDWELGTATMYYVLSDGSLYQAKIDVVSLTPTVEMIVYNETELRDALENENIETIILGDSFDVAASLKIEREVTIEGEKALTFTNGELEIDTDGNTVTLKDLEVIAHNPSELEPASAYGIYVSSGSLEAHNITVDLSFGDGNPGVAPAGIAFHYDTYGEINDSIVKVESKSSAPYGIYASDDSTITVSATDINLTIPGSYGFVFGAQNEREESLGNFPTLTLTNNTHTGGTHAILVYMQDSADEDQKSDAKTIIDNVLYHNPDLPQKGLLHPGLQEYPQATISFVPAPTGVVNNDIDSNYNGAYEELTALPPSGVEVTLNEWYSFGGKLEGHAILDDALVVFEVTEGEAQIDGYQTSSDPHVWQTDVKGWGPPSGFPITDGYESITPFAVQFTETGEVTVRAYVITVDSNETVSNLVEHSFSIQE